MLALILACQTSPTADSAAGSAGEPYADVVFETSGLPNCAASLSDAAHCDGWSIGQGDGWKPEWLGGYEFWGTSFSYSEFYQDPAEPPRSFHCADNAEDAQDLFASLTVYDSEDVEYVIEDDPRWLEVRHSTSSVGYHSRFRIPRCNYFTLVATWPSALATTEFGVELDPIWQVADQPPDRALFMDHALDGEVHRSGLIIPTEYTRVFALGSAGDESLWTFRTCRINGRPEVNKSGTYDHDVVQSDYVMRVGTGSVSYQSTVVRTVTCDHYLLSDPDW